MAPSIVYYAGNSIVDSRSEMTLSGPEFTAQRLAWRDISIGVITLANGNHVRLTLGLGSGCRNERAIRRARSGQLPIAVLI